MASDETLPGGHLNEDVSKQRLDDVLKELESYNLEGRICSTLTRTNSLGGFSDIYIGSFKEDVASNSLFCMVCHFRAREASDVEIVCVSCKPIWSGKLAVKKFRVFIQDKDHLKSIAKELYIFSKLSHPNILPFTGFLIREDFPVIVTPWEEKGDLRRQIESGKLSRSDDSVLQMARGIADGLVYLHSQNILQCDLKSPNILISSTDTPLLTDFGRSQFMGEETSVLFTLTGGSPGSLRWSAPEMFVNKSEHATRANDVWAFGMVLYELITHRLPYFNQRSDFEVVGMLLHSEGPKLPEWPSEEFNDISHKRRALQDICGLCWSRDPCERQDMLIVCRRLHSFPSNSILNKLKKAQLHCGDTTDIVNNINLLEQRYASICLLLQKCPMDIVELPLEGEGWNGWGKFEEDLNCAWSLSRRLSKTSDILINDFTAAIALVRSDADVTYEIQHKKAMLKYLRRLCEALQVEIEDCLSRTFREALDQVTKLFLRLEIRTAEAFESSESAETGDVRGVSKAVKKQTKAQKHASFLFINILSQIKRELDFDPQDVFCGVLNFTRSGLDTFEILSQLTEAERDYVDQVLPGHVEKLASQCIQLRFHLIKLAHTIRTSKSNKRASQVENVRQATRTPGRFLRKFFVSK